MKNYKFLLQKSYVLVFLFISILVHADNVKNPVVLISLDGFAHQYLDKYKPQNLHKLMEQGVSSEGFRPVFPSKTFPNHLAMVTGDYTARMGIIHNNFYRKDLNKTYHMGSAKDDPRWLTSTPIWTLAESQNVKSAIYFWPESDAKINGILPSYYYHYNKLTSNQTRIDQVLNWLKLPKERRPQFVATYFSLVDSAGHTFGPNSRFTEVIVNHADKIIGELVDRIHQEIPYPVNIIIVSDHGMIETKKNSAIDIKPIVKNLGDVKVLNGETQLFIYTNSQQQTRKVFDKLSHVKDERYQVYMKGNFPKHWHWDNHLNHLPDVVLSTKIPYIFHDASFSYSRGTHGFDPEYSDKLNGIFIASGPDFKMNQTVPAFNNVHLFPLLAHLLGLSIVEPVDGKLSVLAPYLND